MYQPTIRDGPKYAKHTKKNQKILTYQISKKSNHPAFLCLKYTKCILCYLINTQVVFNVKVVKRPVIQADIIII